MSLKILILAETLDVDSSSAGKAQNAFIKSLAAEDFDIKAYHYSYKEINIKNVQTILIKENRLDIYYVLSRFQRIFQRMTKLNISRFLETRFGFSYTFRNDVNSMAKTLKLEKPANYDILITLSRGASYRTHAALLKLPKWHKKWLAYIHDPYPFHWYPKPYKWLQAGSAQKEQFFKQVALKARWLGYPSQLLSEWMGQFDSSFIEKVVILPHQIPKNITENINVLPDYFEKDKFTVLHAGNLLAQRNPFPLIEAWVNFLDKNPEVKDECQLLLIGPASYHQPKLSHICTNAPSIFVSDGYRPQKEVIQIETKASVNIILEAVSEISPFLPAKFPGLVKANRPILHLGPEHSESRRLLGSDYEYVAVADDILTISDKLLLLYKEWKMNNSHFYLNNPELQYYFSSENFEKIIKGLKRMIS
ncbi:UDP-glycosyltransferase [Aequorivita sp. F47161]|uniref:UDP-glycosyltransferase n=1 Tax=Aequorivita vitellina TaxID=2874475 RepID=A0A9X1U443_9FLAO|nr:UDP-glycosyltransferase [Aequorivita vitellina]MCG2419882.1 UDP-glycosyltransferase [Aequorivita vitellina]